MKVKTGQIIIFSIIVVLAIAYLFRKFEGFVRSNTQAECSKSKTCKSCADTFGCGWCLSSKKCLARSNMKQCPKYNDYVEFKNQCKSTKRR